MFPLSRKVCGLSGIFESKMEEHFQLNEVGVGDKEREKGRSVKD